MDPQYYDYWRSEMLAFVPEDAKMCLEVGCAGGRFGAQLIDKRGAKVMGIEPVKAAYEIAKTRLTACFNTYFDAEHLPEEVRQTKFDCIIFNDVLEHLENPWAALNLCRELLSPNGCVVASIPNIMYFHEFFRMFWSQDWKYEDGGIFDKTHLRFFTKKSMQRMFAETGYDLATAEGIHPTNSKKFTLWNLFTFFRFKEMRYMQWGVRAYPKK